MKIRKWEDFSQFIGKEMHELVNAMPDIFDRLVLDSGRQVWEHIYTGEKLEVLHDGFGIILKINKIA